MITDVTGVLLAGGKSRRMGEDKRFLHVGERTLLESGLEVLRSVFQEILIIIAQDSPELAADAPVIRDLVPDCGSLGGLYTGLKEATTDDIFVAACDMPFLDSKTIRYFVDLRGDADVAMANFRNQLHPMHALYSRRCLSVIEGMIAAGQLKIQDMLRHPSLRVRIVTEVDLKAIDPDGRSFRNVNTPADLEAARSFIHRKTDAPSH
ncbi:MAG: NTP transferase domain-containing protein [Nitrospira sp. CR1.3]|nr:NTP transferase domain-containing protein [Nitrospira sp. CR1.3]